MAAILSRGEMSLKKERNTVMYHHMGINIGISGLHILVH